MVSSLSVVHELSPAEQRVYDMVCKGDVMCRQLSQWDSGAVPNLINKGLVEIYKRFSSNKKTKKLKYIRLKEKL